MVTRARGGGPPRGGADDDPPIIYRDPARTAAEFARRELADGENWWRVVKLWERIKAPLLDAMLAPFPPVRPLLRLLAELGTSEAIRVARLLVQPANTMASELFAGEAPRVLLLGNAMHADAPPDAPISGAMGFDDDAGPGLRLAGAGRRVGSADGRAGQPCPLRRRANRVQRERFSHRGAGRPGGRGDDGRGRTVRARRAVVADVTAPRLFCDMLPADAVPPKVRRDLEHFAWDPPVVKVNYALREPVPWRAQRLRGVGTVHLGADGDGLVRWMADLNTKTVPDHPFMLLGQTTTADPTRSPPGTESMWAYTHLPRNVADDSSAERLAARLTGSSRSMRPASARR